MVTLERPYIGAIRLQQALPTEPYWVQLPVVRHLQAMETLELKAPVTFFVGENGTGKSTLLEAIAVASGFNAEGGKFLLVQAAADGSVSGQNAGALFALGHQGPGGLPDHVDDGDVDALLHTVQKVVGGVAGHGDDGAARPFQQPGVGEQPGKDELPL